MTEPSTGSAISFSDDLSTDTDCKGCLSNLYVWSLDLDVMS